MRRDSSRRRPWFGGHEQGVGAVQGERDVGGCGGVGHLLGLAADDPAVLVVFGQHRGVACAEPEAGCLFPCGAEPDRVGELDVSERSASRDMAPPFSTACSWPVSPARTILALRSSAQADYVGQVGGGDHRGLVDQQQGVLGDGERAAGSALAGQVAQELGGVVGLGHPGGQGVAGGLRGRDPDDRPSGRGPEPGGFGHHPRLARSGRRVDHGDALAVGQHRQHSRGLIGSQPGTFGMMILNFLRASGQRVLEPRQVGAECSRGVGAGQARRGCCTGLRDEAFLHGQLRAGGVPHAAVPLVDAAPVGAQQAARNLDRLRRLQADHRLELRAQRAVGQVLEQGRGRGRFHAGPGQHAAQVLDQVGAGPGALFLLGQRDGLLRGAGQLQRIGRFLARGRVSCGVMPYRRRDRRQRDAERARELVRPSLRAAARSPARRPSPCAW